MKLLRAVECASLLKSGANGLAEAVKSAVHVVHPTFELADQVNPAVPSISEVRHHTFTLDLAYLLLEQELDCLESEPVRVSMHDSSPLWGYDWLWSQTHTISGGDDLLNFSTTST